MLYSILLRKTQLLESFLKSRRLLFFALRATVKVLHLVFRQRCRRRRCGDPLWREVLLVNLDGHRVVVLLEKLGRHALGEQVAVIVGTCNPNWIDRSVLDQVFAKVVSQRDVPVAVA